MRTTPAKRIVHSKGAIVLSPHRIGRGTGRDASRLSPSCSSSESMIGVGIGVAWCVPAQGAQQGADQALQQSHSSLERNTNRTINRMQDGIYTHIL